MTKKKEHKRKSPMLKEVNNKEALTQNTERKLDRIVELLKDLLILELGKTGFTRENIRKIVGKVSNERIGRILSRAREFSKQKVEKSVKEK